MPNQELLQKYARLVVRVGANVRPGQVMVVESPVESAVFARMVMEEGYAAGAGDVILRYGDQAAKRLRLRHTAEERLLRIPDFVTRPSVHYGEEGACFVHIVGEDPDAYAGLDPQKTGRVLNAEKLARAPFYDLIDKEQNQWTVVGAPTDRWARKVFPRLGEDEALEKLWEAIFQVMRLGENDPVAAWREHNARLAGRCRQLNESGVRTLRLRSGLGTDLTLDLAEDYLWAGGGDRLTDGHPFQANMPTEEVFTMPHKDRAEGRVVSSMPLNYQGTLIRDFSFTFHEGKVVDFDAREGREALELMLEADAGCRRLGEVALVPYDSPIRRTGVLFYETLYDENASCHLALGSAYAANMRGSQELTREERVAKGCNESASHVDFMFGTADLSVVGVREDGTELEIFRDGHWAL